MPTNNGKLKELEIIAHLNGKRVGELSNNLKNLLTALYGVLDDNEIVKCELIEEFIKPDFIITYKGIQKYVSMKTGRAECVHEENIKSFILFLRSLGVSVRTQQTILLYHYGDGTLDGSNNERIEYNKLRLMLESRIEEANNELNSSKQFILEVIERCLITGTLEKAIPIDCVYFGDYRFGEVATTRQITTHIKRKSWDWMKNLHIGPIQLRPHARYYNKEIKSEKRRQKLECYWANLSSDISYISSRYDY